MKVFKKPKLMYCEHHQISSSSEKWKGLIIAKSKSESGVYQGILIWNNDNEGIGNTYKNWITKFKPVKKKMLNKIYKSIKNK